MFFSPVLLSHLPSASFRSQVLITKCVSVQLIRPTFTVRPYITFKYLLYATNKDPQLVVRIFFSKQNVIFGKYVGFCVQLQINILNGKLPFIYLGHRMLIQKSWTEFDFSPFSYNFSRSCSAKCKLV